MIKELFCNNLDLCLCNIKDLNPVCYVLTCDFNVRSSKWWNFEQDSQEVNEIDSITSTAGYNQLTGYFNHVAKTPSSSINLIFTTNPNLIKETGVEFLLFDKCYHNLTFGKLSCKLPFLPYYFREVWDYGKTNFDSIQRSNSGIDSNFYLCNTTVNGKIHILNETIKKAFRNYISHKTIKFDYQNASWMTSVIKRKLKERSKLPNTYHKNGKIKINFDNLDQMSKECIHLILKTKGEYTQKMS